LYGWKHGLARYQHSIGTHRAIQPTEHAYGGRPKKLTYLAHKYYKGTLARGELPPDICLEIALWDRFGWGPEATERLPFKKLKEIFLVLEQQRLTEDAVQNLGKPTAEKEEALIRGRIEEQEAYRLRTTNGKGG
jgi:hypothetical protein